MEGTKKVVNTFICIAIEKEEKLSPLRIMKLVYFANGWYLHYKGVPLIDERIYAWEYGPGIFSIYNRFKKCGENDIKALIPKLVFENNEWSKDYPVISKGSDKYSIIDKVFDTYKDFKDLELSTLAHEKNTPWDQTVKAANLLNINVDYANNDIVIPNLIIKQHFDKKSLESSM